MSDREDRERRILSVLLALRPGEVTTYGDVAEVAGYPKHARLVGRILSQTDIEVAWWRVVSASGVLLAGDVREQTALLGNEGVTVVAGRVRDAPIGRFNLRPSHP